ncbi:uncharacterized protein LOC107818376 [Nicotiana tabacum]|uniref:Uncharacterized protein LOC107818376 n=1 Tax=Nicotiana tabacum TaxID=4097 RepID=A0A1S4CFX0_TOBAC|nr:PREDICTED: uncharacterized protein LOC107818376 [Nicotiana tabacum]
MKGSAKAISSPGRTEKFPPPLMRFLRSNVGSRSRGRSRASPMFMRKNKSNVTVIEPTQEPSSPKVTCIGQVRVRRSSKSAGGGHRTGTRTRRSNSAKKQRKKTCWWKIHKTLFCNNSQGKCYKLHKPKSLISVLKKCLCCFRFWCWRKRVETVNSSTQRVQSRVSTSTTESCSTIENVTNTAKIGSSFVTENKEGFVGSNSSSSSSPPKNALLLTRCRSAPYRSSSLASRFWGSPINSSEETEDNTEIEILKLKTQEMEENPVLENPISPNGENGDLELRKSHGSEEMESSNGESSREEEAEEKNGGVYVHPLLLTRCKSEPAKRGERLNPDSVLCMQRRSTDPDSQT